MARDFVDKVATPTLRGVVDGMSEEVNKALVEKASETSPSVAASATAAQPSTGASAVQNASDQPTQVVPQAASLEGRGASQPVPELATVEPFAKQSEAAPAALALRPSFDCTKASSNVETMICSDAVLAEADKALAEAYSKLIAAHRRQTGKTDVPRIAQLSWIASRNECSNQECLVAKYRERSSVVTAELAELLSPTPVRAAPSSLTPEARPTPQATMIAPSPVAAPAPRAIQNVTVVCPNYREALQVAYPREAQLEGIQGEVLTEFTVGTSGQIRDLEIKDSSNRIFNPAVVHAVQTRLSCKGQDRDIRVQLPFSFKLN